MTLINPFVGYINLDAVELRFQPLGEVGNTFFYANEDLDEERYLRCGGAVYPLAEVVPVNQFTFIPQAGGLRHQSQQGSTSYREFLHASWVNQTSKPTSSSGASSGGGSAGRRLEDDAERYLVNFVKESWRFVLGRHPGGRWMALKRCLSSTARTAPEVSRPPEVAMTALGPLSVCARWLPLIHPYITRHLLHTALQHRPGGFFFRLDADAPLYGDFSASTMSVQAMAFHPYFPIIALALQRSPFEPCLIRFYDAAHGVFVDRVELQHPRMIGVTALAWKPCARDVLAVGIFGGVMVWSVSELFGVYGTHVSVKSTARKSYLTPAAASATDGDTAAALRRSHVGDAIHHTLTNGGAKQQTAAGGRRPMNGSQGIQPLAVASMVGLTPQMGGGGASQLDGSPRRSGVALGSRSSTGSDNPRGSASFTFTPQMLIDEQSFTAERKRLSGDLQQQRPSGRNGPASAIAARQDNEYDNAAATSQSSAAPSEDIRLPSHCLTYRTTAGVPITSIAFSHGDGGAMVCASRGDFHVHFFDLVHRPSDALCYRYTESVSTMSFVLVSLSDAFCLAGLEMCPRLSLIDMRSFAGTTFPMPAPVTKAVHLASAGDDVFALQLHRVEGFSIIRIENSAPPGSHQAKRECVVLADITLGVHRGIGGILHDLCVCGQNVYARVASGHVLVIGVEGSLRHEAREMRQIGAALKGAIPVAPGNRSIISMDAFSGFPAGALVAVAEASTGLLRFVPSYFRKF